MFARKSSSRIVVISAIFIALAAIVINANWGSGSSFVSSRNIDQQVDTAGGKLTMGPVIGDETALVDPAVLDTFTGSVSTQWSFTTSTRRTYMGDGWTNNTLPAGTGSVQITGFTLYMVSGTAAFVR